MSKTETVSPPGGQLERGAMGTADIVFFVLAGVAPMGVVVALLTLSIALGNGAGVPGTYAVVAVLAWFEVTMSAKVLGLALAAEVLILLVFDVAVLAPQRLPRLLPGRLQAQRGLRRRVRAQPDARVRLVRRLRGDRLVRRGEP